MRFILLILFLIIIAFGSLLLSGFTDIRNPQLIQALQSQLLVEYREKSADKFNQSLEEESLGRIFNRAADIFTTTVTLITTRKSQQISLGTPTDVIIHARFFVENSSEEPLEDETYLRFNLNQNHDWIYTGPATANDFYLNFLGLD